MSKHTPGPWHGVIVGVTNLENPDDVYEITNGHTRIAEYVSARDANLLCAAPDLLAACKLALENGDLFNKDAEVLKAAIAKAEGK